MAETVNRPFKETTKKFKKKGLPYVYIALYFLGTKFHSFSELTSNLEILYANTINEFFSFEIGHC